MPATATPDAAGECGIPGTDLPGTDLPGTDLPGTDLPGMDLPGMDLPGMDLPGTDVLGTRVHVLDEHALLRCIDRCMDRCIDSSVAVTSPAGDAPALIAYSHFHTLLDARAHPDIAVVLNAADVNHPDGLGMAWALRTLLGAPVARVNGSDLYPRLVARLLDGGKRVFFLGGSRRTAEALLRLWPDRSATGAVAAMHGEHALEDSAPIDAIAAARPDVLFVGLGSPKQYEWIERFRSRVPARLIVIAGNGVEFLAGTQRRAPRALRRAGLEWLWRFAREPGRLWKRYILGIPRFAFLVLRQARQARRAG